MFNSFAGPDSIIILVIVLLLFGPKNLPKLAQSLGSSVRELKKGLSGSTEEDEKAKAAAAQAAAPVPTPVTEVKAVDTHEATKS